MPLGYGQCGGEGQYYPQQPGGMMPMNTVVQGCNYDPAIQGSICRMMEYGQKKCIDVQAQMQVVGGKEWIKEQAAISKSKQLSDLKRDRMCQEESVTMNKDNELYINYECFSDIRSKKLNHSVKAVCVYECANDSTRKILSVRFVHCTTNREKELWLKLDNLKERNIVAAFDAAGVDFELSRKKEGEVRVKCFNYLISIANHMILPSRHGWYMNVENLAIDFAFPNSFTWKEAERYAN